MKVYIRYIYETHSITYVLLEGTGLIKGCRQLSEPWMKGNIHRELGMAAKSTQCGH